MFFSKPAWYLALPPHLRPLQGKIKQLETLRKSLEVPDHEVLAMMIGCTKWAAVKAQELARDQLRRDLPQYSERELWRAVILTRLGAKLQLEMTKMNFEIENDSVTEDLLERMDSMDEIMAGINSWDDVNRILMD